MTRNDIIAFGKKKYGKNWIGPLALEVNYSFTQLWRVAVGEVKISRRLELEMKQVIRSEQMKAVTKPDVQY